MSVAKSRITSMSESCPICDSETGLREILYGLPVEPVDESKYVIGGCLVSGHDPIWACVDCGWRGWSLNNDLGTKLSEWQCPICESMGKLFLINLDIASNNRLRNFTFSAVTTYGDSTPNAMCLKCGWTAIFTQTYSY